MALFPRLPGETIDEMLNRLTMNRLVTDPRFRNRTDADMEALRVNVEERILESVPSPSVLTLREVTDMTNEHTDSFVLGQGAVSAALDRMAAKGLVTRHNGCWDPEVKYRTPTVFRF